MTNTPRGMYSLRSEIGKAQLGRLDTGDRVYVSAETVRVNGHGQSVYHQPITEWTRLTFTGEIIQYNTTRIIAGGQIVKTLDEIVTFAPGWDAEQVARLANVWENHHLNDMRASCVHQAMREHRTEHLNGSVTVEWFDPAACPQAGYIFGSAWLVDPEDDTLDAIRILRELFKGAT